MSPKLFPLASIVLNLGATALYAVKGDVGRAIYWLLAAGLTFTITFVIGR